MEIDFSQFHPLDHNVLECRGYPGGRLRHLQYQWTFRVQPWLDIRWRHMTGRHSWVAVGRPKDDLVCLPSRENLRFTVICEGCEARPDPATAERVVAEQWGQGPGDSL